MGEGKSLEEEAVKYALGWESFGEHCATMTELKFFSPLLKFPSIALEATCPSTVLDCSAVRFVARLTENNKSKCLN